MEIISYFKKELNYAKKNKLFVVSAIPHLHVICYQALSFHRKMVYFWCTNGVLTALFWSSAISPISKKKRPKMNAFLSVFCQYLILDLIRTFLDRFCRS